VLFASASNDEQFFPTPLQDPLVSHVVGLGHFS
jgi:hypothetical protein